MKKLDVTIGRFASIVAVLAISSLLALGVLSGSISAPALAEQRIGAQETDVVAVAPREFPPIFLVDESGKLMGFGIDAMDHIARQAGLRVTYVVEENWTEAMEALRRGRADLIPNLGITSARQADFSFTAPVQTFRVSLFTRRDTIGFELSEDLAGRRIAVVKANVAGRLLKGRPGVKLETFDDVGQALFELLAGHVDALAYPESVTWARAREVGIEDRIKVVGKPLKEIKRALAVRRDDAPLLARLDAAVKIFVGSPDYQRIYTKWYGKPTPFWTVTRVASVMGSLLVIALLGMGVWRHRSLVGVNRELEQRVAKRTVELEAVNRELETFSYSVSHDLRAPLRSMDGFSHALLEDYADKLDAEGRDYLQRVRAGSQKMAQLIDDLLKLSRVTRGELDHGEVDMSEVAQTVAAELQKNAPERRVTFDIAPGTVVEGDARLLRIVLENLLGNAWKFTAKHDHATIEFGVTNHDGEPAYFVRDDGAGFDMAYADKLFQPFQRLHTSAEFGGTGIGLATVARIVQRHGGSVWAESGVDQGATMYFTL